LFAAASLDPDARGTACDASLRGFEAFAPEAASLARRELPACPAPRFAPGLLLAGELPLDARGAAGWLPEEREGVGLGAVCCGCDPVFML
jgi:hypothetical protein